MSDSNDDDVRQRSAARRGERAVESAVGLVNLCPATRLSTARWRGLGEGIDDKGLVTVAVRPVCDDRRQYFVLGPGRQSHYL